jgi:hypothetical protein
MSTLCSRKFYCAVIVWLSFTCASIARAEEFSLEVASPGAAANFRAKTAAFVFRSKGCAEPGKIHVRGTAEGLVSGNRKTVTLEHLMGMPTPGVFAVSREWPAEGTWLVNLFANCGDSTAGALVTIGKSGIVRESSQFFPRAATKQEIESSLTSFERESRSDAKP